MLRRECRYRHHEDGTVRICQRLCGSILLASGNLAAYGTRQRNLITEQFTHLLSPFEGKPMLSRGSTETCLSLLIPLGGR